MLTLKLAGICGLCLTGILWSIASWRLLYHYIGCVCAKKESTHVVEGMTMKRTFHLCLWFTMFVEAIGYMNLANFVTLNKDITLGEKIGYALNEIIGRGLLEFITFALATSLWFQQTAQARAFVTERKKIFKIAPLLLLLISIGLFVIDIGALIDLLDPNTNDLAQYKSQSKGHKWQALVESCAWFVLMSLVLICGGMIYKRIASLPTYAQVGHQARRGIITKMMLPMAFCAMAYFLRHLWMLVDFFSIVYQPMVNFESGESWWIGNMWLPTAIASVMSLYSIRKRDRSPDAIEGEERDSLIPIAKPPAEAFLSFQRMVGDLDHLSLHDSVEDSFI